MEIKYTEKELNSIDKTLLIKMFLNLQNQMETLTVEMKALNDKMQKMMEQLVLANNNRFGRKTEKMHSVTSLTIRYLRKFLLKTVLECWWILNTATARITAKSFLSATLDSTSRKQISWISTILPDAG